MDKVFKMDLVKLKRKLIEQKIQDLMVTFITFPRLLLLITQIK